MDEKTKGYVAGIICLFVSILFAYVAILSISSMSTAVIMGVLAVFFGGCGFVSFKKPDTVGVAVLQFLRILAKSGEEEEKGSDSHNKQIQRNSNGSVQVMGGERHQININVPKTKEKQVLKSSTMAKTFSCPRGHRMTVYQPDDSHPLASLEEGYAEKYAIGTVISRKHVCEDCGNEITLYWYQEGSGAGLKNELIN